MDERSAPRRIMLLTARSGACRHDHQVQTVTQATSGCGQPAKDDAEYPGMHVRAAIERDARMTPPKPGIRALSTG